MELVNAPASSCASPSTGITATGIWTAAGLGVKLASSQPRIFVASAAARASGAWVSTFSGRLSMPMEL